MTGKEKMIEFVENMDSLDNDYNRELYYTKKDMEMKNLSKVIVLQDSG
jgi:hypothetical protein